jgi:2-oxoglutarate dehydrogenase E1 component
MLRQAAASSPIAELSSGRFLEAVPDEQFPQAQRVMVATGKIVHELRNERRKRQDARTAVIALEQLYPFPAQALAAALARHPQAREVIWVQEEPSNMGALAFVVPRLRWLAGETPVRTVKRSRSPSPATGSAKAHQVEQKTLLTLAFATSER